MCLPFSGLAIQQPPGMEITIMKKPILFVLATATQLVMLPAISQSADAEVVTKSVVAVPHDAASAEEAAVGNRSLPAFGGGDGGGESSSGKDTPTIYLPDVLSYGTSRGCFSSPGDGGPVLCLEMRSQYDESDYPGGGSANKPSQIFLARIYKAEVTGSFKYQHNWNLKDRSGRLSSVVFSDTNGSQCGDWQQINLSLLPCGTSYVQAQVWSPADCQSSNCSYSTGAVQVGKYCGLGI